MIVLSRSKGTERLQDLCLNWYKQTNSLRMASLVCKGRHCGSPEIQHQLLSATSQDPTWKITFSENISKQLHCVILSTTFRHIAKHCCKSRENVDSIYFVFCTVNVTMSDCQYSQCQNATMSQYSQCHNIPNISMSHYSQYINVTRSKYFTMSQCHNVTLFTISRCHNEQSTHLAPHSAMTKPAAKVTSRCNTVETGDLCASLGCMGKM